MIKLYTVYDEDFYGRVISESVSAHCKEESIKKCNELYGFGAEAKFIGYGIVNNEEDEEDY